MFANGKFKCAENNVEVEWMDGWMDGQTKSKHFIDFGWIFLLILCCTENEVHRVQFELVCFTIHGYN